jgi:hypothetical protein
MNTSEGCSVISDLTGAVRFYTDGGTVWNSNNQVMQNGTGLLGNSSATQSALIVPWPGDCTRYIIFTVDAAEDNLQNGLRYSVVNMNLNNGLGGLDPVLKNKPLQTPGLVDEKLTAVRDADQSDYWVVAHGYAHSMSAPEATQFYAFHVTSSGLSASPVTSSVGQPHYASDFGNAQGQMKISPDGHRLALAVTYAKFAEIFDFNSSTGTVSNPVKLDLSGFSNSYGIAFSPNGQVLYVSTTASSPNALLGFDLTAANIAGSRTPLYSHVGSGNYYDIGALELGPDGKIYVARPNDPVKHPTDSVGTISSPNSLATAVFTPDAVHLAAGTHSRLGLPTSVEGPFSCAPPAVVDPCCPPWTAQRLEDMLFYRGSGGIAAPYTLQFEPTNELKAQIQAYIDYPNALDPGITQITIQFRLHDAGAGATPLSGAQVGSSHYVTWGAGGNGEPTNGAVDFFSLGPESMQVNHWYRVHTGIYIDNPGKQFFPQKCANNDVDVRIQVQPVAAREGAGRAVLQLRTADGHILEKPLSLPK